MQSNFKRGAVLGVSTFALTAFLASGALSSGITSGAPFGIENALADATAPAADVRSVIETVQQTVKTEKSANPAALDEKLKGIILPVFNFEEMSKRSLGAAWTKATPEEQKEFVSLFSDLLSRTYLKKIRQNAEEAVILKMTDSVEGDKAVVKSKMKAGEDTVQIDYRMSLDAGKWRCYDVIIENVGLVSNYRNEFPGIVRNEGFKGLIQRLKDKKSKPVSEQS